MNRLSELKALAELAEQLEENGHFVEANTVHNQFLKLAQANRTYKVQTEFETLSDISNKTGVSVYKLQYYNNGIKDSNLKKGLIINLGPAPKPKNPNIYEASMGDSLSTIARNNNISLNTLLKLNPGIDPNEKLYSGTKIRLK